MTQFLVTLGIISYFVGVFIIGELLNNKNNKI